MTCRDERPDGGFLYIEALAGLVLLAFTMLATVPLFTLAARGNAESGDLTFAMTAATDKAEELKQTHFDKLEDGSDEVRNRSVGYDRTWEVEDDQPHPGMRTITVTVTPRRTLSHGQNRTATVLFYRSR